MSEIITGADGYAPLNTLIVKALSEKAFEKRKAAAVQVESIVRDLAASKDTQQIKRAITVIHNLIHPDNPNSTKGSLSGLAAVALGLGVGAVNPFIVDLLTPVFPHLKDSTPMVRYYAAEALYNICRVSHNAVLYMFNDIFTVNVDLSMDTDSHVKKAADMLNHVLKDIVIASTDFNLDEFIPVLREKLYVQDPPAQSVVVSWVSTLLNVPHVCLIPSLPEILDGIFLLLESPNTSIKKSTETVLGDLLWSIEKDEKKTVDCKALITILTVHAQSQDARVQSVALLWIVKFVEISASEMVPFISGILNATLPCLAYDNDTHLKCKDLAEELSYRLIQLVQVEEPDNENLKLSDIIDVFLRQLRSNNPVPCKATAIRWIYNLNIKFPVKMKSYVDKIFEPLVVTICDPADEVVLLGIQVLAQISSQKESSVEKKAEAKFKKIEEPYFTRFMTSLLHLFDLDRTFLSSRGQYVIRELCVVLPAEEIYSKLSQLLQKESSLEFITEMVQTLSIILLTSRELACLRLKLRDLSCKKNSELFTSLYKTWCHNPVSTLTLCLLCERYRHAECIVHELADIDISTNFLIELDNLIQIIESPIFSFLRMKLLSPDLYPSLVKSLYGILMILPQSEAFHSLRTRLNCIPPEYIAKASGNTENSSFLNDEELLSYFKNVQKSHKEYKHDSLKNKLEASMHITVKN